jgi:hypothetical protein
MKAKFTLVYNFGALLYCEYYNFASEIGSHFNNMGAIQYFLIVHIAAIEMELDWQERHLQICSIG